MHFDGKGIRDVNEMKVLQYRTMYLNGTPITYDSKVDITLRAMEVAHLDDEDVLRFLVADKQRIWPSKYSLVWTII